MKCLTLAVPLIPSLSSPRSSTTNATNAWITLNIKTPHNVCSLPGLGSTTSYTVHVWQSLLLLQLHWLKASHPRQLPSLPFLLYVCVASEEDALRWYFLSFLSPARIARCVWTRNTCFVMIKIQLNLIHGKKMRLYEYQCLQGRPFHQRWLNVSQKRFIFLSFRQRHIVMKHYDSLTYK